MCLFELKVFVFSKYMPRSGIAGSYAGSLSKFSEEPSILFTVRDVAIHIPSNSVGELPSSHSCLPFARLF